MTVLDVLSCVSSAEITTALVPRVKPTEILSTFDVTATLTQPKLMIDASAIAVTFLTSGYIPLRSTLWERVVEHGTVPVMRYVSISAHVTLIRFLEDIEFTKEQMTELIARLQSISVSSIGEWKIGKEDLKCVYGQVYYGGGKELS